MLTLWPNFFNTKTMLLFLQYIKTTSNNNGDRFLQYIKTMLDCTLFSQVQLLLNLLQISPDCILNRT